MQNNLQNIQRPLFQKQLNSFRCFAWKIDPKLCTYWSYIIIFFYMKEKRKELAPIDAHYARTTILCESDYIQSETSVQLRRDRDSGATVVELRSISIYLYI